MHLPLIVVYIYKEAIPWNTGNKTVSHLGITRLNTMQTLTMLCLKDIDSVERQELQSKKSKSDTAGTCPFHLLKLQSESALTEKINKLGVEQWRQIM